MKTEFLLLGIAQARFGFNPGAYSYRNVFENKNFQVIFIKNLDAINLQTRRSEARRFISLIDNLYDHRIGVVFLSKVLPQDLFVIKDWDSIVWSEEERLFMEQFYGGERFSTDDIMKDAGKNISFSMLSGDDEKFAVARLLSRMHDMKSQGYWADIQRKMAMYRDSKHEEKI